MKTLHVASLAAVALGLLTVTDLSAQETPESLLAQGLKRYPVESGIVEYELSGNQTARRRCTSTAGVGGRRG